jgi:hypothetical protein
MTIRVLIADDQSMVRVGFPITTGVKLLRW